MTEQSFNDDFYLEAALAVTVTVMVANVALIIKIKYGDVMITKLTMLPYFASLGVLIINLSMQLFIIVGTHFIYKDDVHRFFRQISFEGTTLNKIFIPLSVLRIAFALLFFFVRAFEAEAMLIFIKF